MSGSWQIPFFGVDRQYQSIRQEILQYTDKVYSSGQVLGGDFTQAFEREIAKRCNRKYAVSVNSCSQALIFALRSLPSQHRHSPRRKKILVPAISYIATLNAVIEAGHDVVFCDVDPITGLIDLKHIPVPIQEIDAILYVNLFGNCVNYKEILGIRELFSNNDITIIEDAAQSFGASSNDIPSGKLGDISCLSFDPTKNLNNYGSGGMLLTDDFDCYQAILDYKDNGKTTGHVASGTNSKMSESDCAQLLVKLKYFDQWQRRRNEIAEYFNNELSGYVVCPEVDHTTDHAWHKYVIHHSNRSAIQDGLEQEGIETKIHYDKPLHLESVGFMSTVISHYGELPGAEEFSKTCLSLPIYPELTDDEVESIVSAVRYYS